MDNESEIARAKWLLFAGGLFLVSCFLCYTELVYVVSGRQTQADITNAYEVDKRGRFGLTIGKKLTIEYSFSEADGTRRTGSDTVRVDWLLPDTGTIPVRYTAGKDGRSRLAGHVNWIGIVIFAVSIAAMGTAGFRLWRMASEAASELTPKRKR
jgi:hypothetical protein